LSSCQFIRPPAVNSYKCICNKQIFATMPLRTPPPYMGVYLPVHAFVRRS